MIMSLHIQAAIRKFHPVYIEAGIWATTIYNN